MGAKVFGWSKLIAILLAVAALTFLAIRVYDVQRGPALEVWHTYVPRELDAEAIDKTDWNGYLAKEARIFDDLRREVAELRATIAELSKRLETLEYQKMPRAELPIPQLAEPRNPVPSYVWPTVQPARFPVEVHQMPKTTSAPTKRSVPAYLRFSEEIERAMMGPF